MSKLKLKYIITLLFITGGILYFAGVDIGKELECIVCSFQSLGTAGLLIGVGIYAICLMVPFFPGLEIGIVLMLTFGEKGILLVYLATIVALIISFFIGRYFKDNVQDKLSFMDKYQLRSSSKFGFLDRYRSRFKNSPFDFSLVFLLNTPGNSLIGGGGGIAFLYGAKSKMHSLKFALSIALATMPVPLLIFIGIIHI